MSGKKELPLLMASMICGVLCSGGNTTTMSFGELLCDNGETLMLSAPASWNGKLNGSSIAVEFSKNRCRIPCDCKQQNLAELETEIDVPAAGEIRIGCGADWYFEFIVDGSIVYSTWRKGNGTADFGCFNHIFQVPVRAGRHRIRVRLRNGMGGMSFHCGPPTTPPYRNRRPVPSEKLMQALSTLYASDCRRLSPERRTALQVCQDALDLIEPGNRQPEQPVNQWLDLALEKIKREVPAEPVSGNRVVLWLVYNMGVIVKTSGATFGIDICHPRAAELADLLDFAMITHFHPDHFDRKFVEAMQREGFIAGKPVLSSFYPSRHFRKYPAVWQFGDITIRTGDIDHNEMLPNFVTTYEILCGKGKEACTILHTGDGANVAQLNPARHVNILIAHPRPFGEIHFAAEAASKLTPDLLIVGHLQEISHGFGPGRWSYQTGFDECAGLPASVTGVVPVWGEKIIFDPKEGE